MRVLSRAGALFLLVSLALPGFAQSTGQAITVTSGGREYASYLTAGTGAERMPGIVLIHSFNGLEQGNKDMVDRFAGEGFVVLAAGVAWYGFPNTGGSAAQPVKPIDEISQLQHPLLMIHGSADQASPIAGIYQYATALQQAGKYFELKVYQGLPHGFMVQNGQLWRGGQAEDAFAQMVSFFKRTLR